MKGILKMLAVIMLFIILLLIGLLSYMSSQTPDFYQGRISNHFDGKYFYNPEKNYQDKKSFALFKWWFNRQRAKWPSFVENIYQPQLADILKSNEVRITFINHSTVLIQTKDLNILTDPVWSKRVSPFSFMGPERVRKPGVSLDELPSIDLVVISHNHYDHLDVETLQRLAKKFHPVILVPLGNKAFLARYKIDNVVEMNWWNNYKIKSAKITFLPTRHWSARWLNDKFRTLWGSYGIEVENKKIYFAGDTGFSLNNFSEIHTKWGAPDIALLPIGAYKPEWFMQQNHMNPEEAVQAHLLLQSKYSIPIHYGTFQLSDESINEPVDDLQKALIKHQLNSQIFQPLAVGESKLF